MEIEEILQKELTKLKAENEELKSDKKKLRKDKNVWRALADKKQNELIQLKEKMKEVEDCYKLGWEDWAKAAANDIASRI